MKNNRKNNAGMSILEVLVAVALVAVIALAVFNFTDRINPEGYETIAVLSVGESESGFFALTNSGQAYAVGNADIAAQLTAGEEHRVKIEADEAGGLPVITARKAEDGSVAVADPEAKHAPLDQKKRLTENGTIPPLALALGSLGLGLFLAVWFLVRNRITKSGSSAQSSPQVSASVSQAVETPPAPPAASTAG